MVWQVFNLTKFADLMTAMNDNGIVSVRERLMLDPRKETDELEVEAVEGKRGER